VKLSIVHKLSLGTIFLILSSVGVVSALFYIKTTEVLVQHALDDISGEIKDAGILLKTRVSTQSDDTLFLASTPPIQGMLGARLNADYDRLDKSTYAQWKSRLETIFTGMLKRKPSYLKIRFIDADGQELVVVGRAGERVIPLSDDQLQNKSHRDYVIDTLSLDEGTIYISDINLNREFGVITEPYQEVLRSATPVYDEVNGKVAGLIVIAVDIGNELRDMQKRILDLSGSHIYITNENGDYLLHPDPGKTYGFDLGRPYNIQDDIPQLENLFFSDSTVTSLTLRTEDTGIQQVINFSKIAFNSARPENFIAVVITQNYSSIVAEQSKVLDEITIWVLFLTVAGTGLGVLFSIRLTRPIKDITQVMDDYTHHRSSTALMPLNQNDEIGLLAKSYTALIRQVDEAQNRLRTMNRDLETMVAERTGELELSEKRQRDIVENMVDGVITIDDNGIVSSFNTGAVKIFGYRPDEVIGNNVKMLMPEPYQSEHDGYLENYHATGEKKIIGIGREVEGKRKNGSKFPMELAVSAIMIDDKKLFTGLVRDITDRKQMDIMKNEFISTVSHELRTPLTSIRGSLGLISGGAAGELPVQANELIKIASNNTERLLLLINDILDIQKIESGQMVFKFQSLDVVPFLEQALRDHAAYGEQHGVKFVIAQTVPGTHVFADKDRLMQVMANLLSNAAKFSPGGETVEVSVARHHGDTIRISVTDHGPGIPEAFQPRLFEKFTQSDSSDTRKKGGTGLGLSITRVIVEKHGGLIDFISREGVGSTFYIELPELMGERIGSDSEPLRIFLDNHLPCILIVEDDPDVAALLQRMLAEAGFNSDIAYDANEARQQLLLKPDQYKAITLDLILPGEGGISLLNDLRSQAATHDIPVIVVSVKADETKRSLSGGAVGVVDWLQKPIDQQRLITCIKQAAGGAHLPRILHVEDEPDVHKIVSTMLRDYCELTWTTTLAASQEALENEKFDLVLLDIGLPDGSGLDLLETIERRVVPPKVVIFSAYDVEQEHADRVSAVLMKSKIDNSKLAEVISSVINQCTDNAKQ